MVTIAKKNNQLIIENIGEFCDIDYTHFCSVIDYFITCKRLIIDYLKKACKCAWFWTYHINSSNLFSFREIGYFWLGPALRTP